MHIYRTWIRYVLVAATFIASGLNGYFAVADVMHLPLNRMIQVAAVASGHDHHHHDHHGGTHNHDVMHLPLNRMIQVAAVASGHDHHHHDHHGRTHNHHEHAGANLVALDLAKDGDASNVCHSPACHEPVHYPGSHHHIDGHVHCCGSTAIPSASHDIVALTAARVEWPITEWSLPLGQRFYPLLRPPRTHA